MNLSNEMFRRTLLLAVALLARGTTAAGQESLSLVEAIARARTSNPDAEAAVAGLRESESREAQARASLWPRVDLTESWQRGNQPVFVFSSLLSQRRFTAANFAIPELNRPAATDNFRAAVMAEQSIYNPATHEAISVASVTREIAEQRRALVAADLAAAVTDAYARAIAAGAARQSARAAVEAARTDRELAANRRDAGLATDGDVLQVDVHLARAREQEIRSAADERSARAELNALIGAPLDASFQLALPLPEMLDLTRIDLLRAQARPRPSVTIAVLGERLAGERLSGAKTRLLPQFAAQGGWEFNGGSWSSRSSSWIVGVTAVFNVFRGFGDQARVAEARDAVARAASERRKAEDAAGLDIYNAASRLEAARATEVVAAAAVTQALEARRIIRDRYETGLADLGALLRAAESVAQAETRHVEARSAVIVETAALQRALGRS
jgi:outer membrane protein